MNKRTLILISLGTIILLSGLLLAACGQAKTPTGSGSAPTVVPSPTQPDGKPLLQERCTVCHSADRITSAHKTAEEWQVTVTRMVGKGAKLDALEQQALVEYLAQTYP
jgi:cytochrome c5